MPPRTGSRNKNTQFLMKRLQDMYGEDFDPIIKMAQNATKLQGLADEKMENMREIENASGTILWSYAQSLMDANKEWERIAPYVAAKLKALEITQGEDPETGEKQEWKITVVKPSDT